MTLQHADVHPAVRWMNPATGLWVASRPGEHAGVVERIDGRYVAMDARGTTLGSFERLPDAQAAVEGGGAGARRVSGLTRRLVGLNAAIGSVLVVVVGALIMR